MATKRGLSSEAVKFLAVDLEHYERGREILEVGLAWTKGSTVWPQPAISCQHLIVSDHLSLRNGLDVADNRDRFNFGASEYVAQSELGAHLTRIFQGMVVDDEQTYLIGHSVRHDLGWLRGLGVPLDLDKLTVCDIGQAYQAKGQALELTGLSRMMDNVGLHYENLHNGGNDAVYSLQVGLLMMAQEDQRLYEEAEEQVETLL
jgi:hypothetical protein